MEKFANLSIFMSLPTDICDLILSFLPICENRECKNPVGYSNDKTFESLYSYSSTHTKEMIGFCDIRCKDIWELNLPVGNYKYKTDKSKTDNSIYEC